MYLLASAPALSALPPPRGLMYAIQQSVANTSGVPHLHLCSILSPLVPAACVNLSLLLKTNKFAVGGGSSDSTQEILASIQELQRQLWEHKNKEDQRDEQVRRIELNWIGLS